MGKKADSSGKTRRNHYRIWNIVYPFIIYYCLVVALMIIARSFLGNDSEHYMLCQTLTDIFAIPVMYIGFFRNDPLINGKNVKAEPIWLLYIAICVAAGMLFNFLITLSGLTEISQGFSDANSNFFGGSMPVLIIGAGILTPILEELVFRGILFGRMKNLMKPGWAILLSSLTFAFVHFNLVQFLYAFLVGLLLARMVDRTGSILTSMAAHAILNTLVILLF